VAAAIVGRQAVRSRAVADHLPLLPKLGCFDRKNVSFERGSLLSPRHFSQRGYLVGRLFGKNDSFSLAFRLFFHPMRCIEIKNKPQSSKK
jgi:hypothetical protein